ncbi:MAG: hypothetical protein EOP35_07760 [Rubrivivax sp.]|nr:MAG: hypothetical protein EOP35_07760 [Rubrivivax sp.]
MPLPRPWAILAVCLVVITALFGAPADHSPALQAVIATAALVAGGVLTWLAGARVVVRRDAGDHARQRAASAALLVAPFILFGLAPGMGPPSDEPTQDNQLRFLLLAIDPMLVCAGLLLLKEALAGAGERFLAPMGLAAILLATPLYIAFALIQRVDYVALALNWTWASTVSGRLHELTPLDAFGMAALFFASALTYVATVAYAASLARAGWLGRRAALVLQLICCLGLAFLVARGFAYPNPHVALSHWITVPGFVAGIPAVPWMPLCAIGVMLLRRTGREPATASGELDAPARRSVRQA